MGHEHNGNCCNDHENIEVQLHHAIENMGSLCCTGQCHHVNHQLNIEAAFEQQDREQWMNSHVEATENSTDKKKRKRKNETPLRWFGQQLTQRL